MWCGFISLDLFRFKGRVIEGTQTLDLFSMVGGLYSLRHPSRLVNNLLDLDGNMIDVYLLPLALGT